MVKIMTGCPPPFLFKDFPGFLRVMWVGNSHHGQDCSGKGSSRGGGVLPKALHAAYFLTVTRLSGKKVRRIECPCRRTGDMVKGFMKPHLLKRSQGPHGVHPPHASSLDDKANGVFDRVPAPFLFKDFPGFLRVMCVGNSHNSQDCSGKGSSRGGGVLPKALQVSALAPSALLINRFGSVVIVENLSGRSSGVMRTSLLEYPEI